MIYIYTDFITMCTTVQFYLGNKKYNTVICTSDTECFSLNCLEEDHQWKIRLSDAFKSVMTYGEMQQDLFLPLIGVFGPNAKTHSVETARAAFAQALFQQRLAEGPAPVTCQHEGKNCDGTPKLRLIVNNDEPTSA